MVIFKFFVRKGLIKIRPFGNSKLQAGCFRVCLCADHHYQFTELFSRFLCSHNDDAGDYSSLLSFLPFMFTNDDLLGFSLFFHSKFSLTRSLCVSFFSCHHPASKIYNATTSPHPKSPHKTRVSCNTLS